MAGFDVTPVELQVCGSLLSQISAEVRDEVRALQRDMDDLLTSGWHGAAANGFATGWSQWVRGAHEVLDALHDMGCLLGNTGQDYQTGDAGSAANLNRAGEEL